MSKSIIGIVNYGAGNINSIRNGIKKLGYWPHIVHNPSDLEEIALLILPGVGAFSAAMNALRQNSMLDAIQKWHQQGKPILGICLGMQLLATHSYEHGINNGLDIISGSVEKLTCSNWHIGYNQLQATAQTPKNLIPMLRKDYYFNHAYVFKTKQSNIIATTTPASQVCTAMIQHDNVIGVQYHPEKSQGAGLEMLKILIEDLLHA